MLIICSFCISSIYTINRKKNFIIFVSLKLFFFLHMLTEEGVCENWCFTSFFLFPYLLTSIWCWSTYIHKGGKVLSYAKLESKDLGPRCDISDLETFSLIPALLESKNWPKNLHSNLSLNLVIVQLSLKTSQLCNIIAVFWTDLIPSHNHMLFW